MDSYDGGPVRAGLLLVAVLTGACAGADIPTPSVIDANRSGIALGRLERGRAVYLEKCTRCHSPVAPRDYSSNEWPGRVDEMTDRSKISQDEKQLILTYLTTMSSTPK